MARKKNKKLNTAFFIILIIIVGYLYFKFSPSSFNPKNENNTNAVEKGNFPNYLKIEKKIISSKPNWYKEIKAEYPVGDVVGVSEVEKFVRKEVDGLMCANDEDKLSQDQAKNKGMTDLYQCSLDIKYSYTNNNKLISHKISEYGTYGGTHGIYIAETFTYDTKGNLLQFSDLIDDQSNYKKIVSDKLKAGFKKIAKENQEYDLNSVVDDVTQESKIDTIPFLVTHEGIKFLFSEMNGLDYGMGEIEVLINFDELKGLIKSEFLN